MDNTELIYKFLDKELNENEKILFKEKFNNDLEFAKEVRRYTDIIVVIRAVGKIRKNWIKIMFLKLFTFRSVESLLIIKGYN